MGIVEKAQETSFDTDIYHCVLVPVTVLRYVLECRDTPTSQFDPHICPITMYLRIIVTCT